MGFNAAAPADTEAWNVTLTRLLANDISNQIVDAAAVLATQYTRGTVVKWNPGTANWSLCNGTVSSGATDIIGIVTDTGPNTVKISGIYLDNTLTTNTAYYCQANGSLGTTQTKVFMGYVTSPGCLCLPSMGGGGGSGSLLLPPNAAVSYRWDQYANASTAVQKTGELYTIPTTTPYVIRLNEIPRKDTPSSLTMQVADNLPAAITSATQTNITVGNAGWHAINEIIQVDSEKMQVTAVYASQSITTASAAITTTTATSLTVANGAPFYPGQICKIDSEQMLIYGVSGTTLSVVRAWNGTAAATHASGANVYLMNQLTVTRGYASTAAANHAAGVQVFIQGSMTEAAAAPAPGQFWADYNTSANGYAGWNNGQIEFNASDAGKQVAVTYKGVGLNLDDRAITQRKWLFTNVGTANYGLAYGTAGTASVVVDYGSPATGSFLKGQIIYLGNDPTPYTIAATASLSNVYGYGVVTLAISPALKTSPNGVQIGFNTAWTAPPWTTPQTVFFVTLSGGGGGGAGSSGTVFGGAGGTTSFGSYVSAAGGGGGTINAGFGGAPGGPGGEQGGSSDGAGGVASGYGGGSIFGIGGQVGLSSVPLAATSGAGYGGGGGGMLASGVVTGQGGGGADAKIAIPVTGLTAGQQVPVTIGAGGAGGAGDASHSTWTGGTGAPGFVLVEC